MRSRLITTCICYAHRSFDFYLQHSVKLKRKKSDVIRPRDSSEAPEWCKKITTLEISTRQPSFLSRSPCSRRHGAATKRVEVLGNRLRHAKDACAERQPSRQSASAQARATALCEALNRCTTANTDLQIVTSTSREAPDLTATHLKQTETTNFPSTCKPRHASGR